VYERCHLDARLTTPAVHESGVSVTRDSSHATSSHPNSSLEFRPPHAAKMAAQRQTDGDVAVSGDEKDGPDGQCLAD